MQRNTLSQFLWIAFIYSALFSMAITPAFAQENDSDRAAPCSTITSEAQARGYGYYHVVTVTNRCTTALQCQVWTNVDPEPKHTLTVPPNQSRQVVTRIGSPAREVTAYGTCNDGRGGQLPSSASTP